LLMHPAHGMYREGMFEADCAADPLDQAMRRGHGEVNVLLTAHACSGLDWCCMHLLWATHLGVAWGRVACAFFLCICSMRQLDWGPYDKGPWHATTGSVLHHTYGHMWCNFLLACKRANMCA
jgi:hypothetical protein